ncbi:hypothetical protein [Kitasatospora sp. NPDC056181]|uniref:hypothetical protein n=1 Tax=Kitasatospora sp. NPDC056181 TaxID=3345737 RepID=UPI0035DCCED8
MSHQEIPEERLKALQAIVDANPHASLEGLRGEDCDAIQAEMDSWFGSAMEEPGAGWGFVVLFFKALIKGCPFVWGADVEIDPTKGDPFQLQTIPFYGSDTRGTKVKMYDKDINVLFSNSINTKGNYDPDSDTHNLFRLGPAGKTNSEGRALYYLFVQDGAHAGKSLSTYPADGTRHIQALEHDPDTAHMWTVGREIHSNDAVGNRFECWTSVDDFVGYLDIPDGKGGHPMDCWADKTGNNQVWHFRPASYQG